MQRGRGMMDASEGRRRSSLASPTRPTERAGLCFAAAHWDDQQGQARPAGMPRRRDFQVASSQVCPALRSKDAHAQPSAAVTGIRARSRTVAGGPGVGMSERRSRSLEARNGSGVRAARRARATMLREAFRREPVHRVCRLAPGGHGGCCRRRCRRQWHCPWSGRTGHVDGTTCATTRPPMVTPQHVLPRYPVAWRRIPTVWARGNAAGPVPTIIPVPPLNRADALR
jgi:hypothetical protein